MAIYGISVPKLVGNGRMRPCKQRVLDKPFLPSFLRYHRVLLPSYCFLMVLPSLGWFVFFYRIRLTVPGTLSHGPKWFCRFLPNSLGLPPISLELSWHRREFLLKSLRQEFLYLPLYIHCVIRCCCSLLVNSANSVLRTYGGVEKLETRRRRWWVRPWRCFCAERAAAASSALDPQKLTPFIHYSYRKHTRRWAVS